MLLSNSIRNLVRSNATNSLFPKQVRKYIRMTPISCSYHHFHRNEDEICKRRTGLALGNYSANSLNNLHKSIHSSSAVYFKYSNLLADKQKVGGNVKIKSTTTTTDSAKTPDMSLEALEEVEKLGLFARFKKMAKDYWYVLIPVHVATSSLWLGGFYYASKR